MLTKNFALIQIEKFRCDENRLQSQKITTTKIDLNRKASRLSEWQVWSFGPHGCTARTRASGICVVRHSSQCSRCSGRGAAVTWLECAYRGSATEPCVLPAVPHRHLTVRHPSGASGCVLHHRWHTIRGDASAAANGGAKSHSAACRGHPCRGDSSRPGRESNTVTATPSPGKAGGLGSWGSHAVRPPLTVHKKTRRKPIRAHSSHEHTSPRAGVYVCMMPYCCAGPVALGFSGLR